MRNILLIARREYMERIRAKSFLVMTVLIPLIMGGGLFASVYFGGNSQRTPHITIVSTDTQVAIAMRDRLATTDPGLAVDAISPPTADTLHILSGDVEDKDSIGFLWVDPSAPAGAQQAIFYGRPGKSRVAEMEDALTHTAGSSGLHMPVTVSVQDIRRSQHEVEHLTRAQSAQGMAYFLFFLMYMAVMLYGMNVARSITEEKTSRVFEVMLATITPEEMMAGKITGVGGVGLTQVFIWIVAAAAIVSSPLVPPNLAVALSAGPILFFLLMFVLGFMLYSGIAAILGAIVNSEQELQQLTMVLAMPLAVCFFLLYPISTNPDGALATFISMVPLWTPLIMFMRVAVGHPPVWQVALSVADLLFANYAIMWIASRIYRVGILMYGKRPSLAEILRWMRYS